MRHFRRSRRVPRNIVRTYKKVLNFAPTSQSAGTKHNFDIMVGADSTAIGQTGPVDAVCPTGSIIDYVDIYYVVANLVSVFCGVHFSVQSRLSGQGATVAPNVVGGNPQRNQVYHQELRSIGEGQNMTIHYRWKVPKHIQRVRESSVWSIVLLNTAASTDSCQVIYKCKQ